MTQFISPPSSHVRPRCPGTSCRARRRTPRASRSAAAWPSTPVASAPPEDGPELVLPRPSRVPWLFALVGVGALGGYAALWVPSSAQSADEGPEASLTSSPSPSPASHQAALPSTPAPAEAATPAETTGEAPPTSSAGMLDEAPAGAQADAATVPAAPLEKAGAVDMPEARTTAHLHAPQDCACAVESASPPPAALAPRPAPTSATQAAARLFAKGRQALDAGKTTEALARFKRAVARMPKSPDAWFGLALARTDLKQSALARAAAEHALALDPRHAGATLLLGFLAQQKKDNETSKKLYARYLELDPQGEYVDEVRAVIAQLP